MLEPRMNVEKMELQRGHGEPCEADVVLFQLETDELLTIEVKGSGVAVLLSWCVWTPSGRTSSASPITSTRS